MSVMEYDITIKILSKDFKEALVEKRDFYAYLCQDFINLEELNDKG